MVSGSEILKADLLPSFIAYCYRFMKCSFDKRLIESLTATGARCYILGVPKKVLRLMNNRTKAF